MLERIDAVAATTGAPVRTMTADAGYAYAKVYGGLGHRLINAQPDAGCGEFDEGEEIGVVFLVSGRDGPVMLELREEPFDPVASSVGVAVERRGRGSPRDRPDDGLRADRRKVVAQSVAVIGSVSEQGLARPDRAQHVICRSPVVGLPGGQLQRDRQAARIGDGVNLGRQAAPRAPHADGSNVSQAGGAGGLRTPLFAFAPCW